MIEFNPTRDIGLKISSYSSLSKCISIIRKYRNVSISSVKQEIEAHDFIFVCDFTDTANLIKLIACHDDLINAESSVTIQEQNRLITREVLLNLLQMHKDLYEETIASLDAEVEEF